MQIDEFFFPSIDSTNEYAKENRSSFKPNNLTMISADHQTSGKGRFDRKWYSPIGNIYTTFYFRLPSNQLHLTSIAHVLALSLIDVLLKENLQPKIKWPNDIFLNNKKIAGILAEISLKDNMAEVFLGIGINVNMDQSHLSKIDKPATSLKVETNKMWEIKDLLQKLQQQFIKNLEIFKKEGFTYFHSEFENLLLYKGEKITFFDGKKEHSGVLHSITCEGLLNLYLPSKEIQTFAAGDII